MQPVKSLAKQMDEIKGKVISNTIVLELAEKWMILIFLYSKVWRPNAILFKRTFIIISIFCTIGLSRLIIPFLRQH
jgi:hypothetical protein